MMSKLSIDDPDNNNTLTLSILKRYNGASIKKINDTLANNFMKSYNTSIKI